MNKATFAAYDITAKNDPPVHEIVARAISFIVSVYNNAVTSSRWEKVGTLPLEEALTKLPMKFIQDAIYPEQYELYNPNTGEISPASKQDCLKLEPAAVWEAEHVEKRIADFYANKPNKWVEGMKIKR